VKIPSDFRIGGRLMTVGLTIIAFVVLWLIVNGIYALV